MKKIIMMLSVLAWMLGACSDDENTAVVPELPDNDFDISIPEDQGDWEPGMEYQPYSDNLPPALGIPVNVLVVGEGRRAQEEMAVLENNAWLWYYASYGEAVEQEENIKECYFPNHPDVHIYMTGSETDFNPERIDADIVVLGMPVEDLVTAKRNMEQLMEKFEEYPLVIAAAQGYGSYFTQNAWDLCLRIGGLEWDRVWRSFPEWGDLSFVTNRRQLTSEQQAYWHPGNVGAAYALQNVDGYNHAEDWIVVGGYSDTTNMPGVILDERWIYGPNTFNVLDAEVGGGNLGAAYVAKIAAEVKRRLPHFTNAQIAELIFENADELGASGTYGHGMINPMRIWEAVEDIEKQANGE